MPDTFSDLFIGYTVFWIILAGFCLRLMVGQRRLEREIRELRDKT